MSYRSRLVKGLRNQTVLTWCSMESQDFFEAWIAAAVHGRCERERHEGLDGHARLRQALGRLHTSLERLRSADEGLSRQMETLAAAREATRRECRRFEDLFDSAPIAYIETDLGTTILNANQRAASLLGKERRLLVGEPLPHFIAAPDRRRFRRHMGELMENPQSGEWQTRIAPCNSMITISVALTVQVPPEREGASLRWVVRDLRELRRAQAESMTREESLGCRAVQQTAALARDAKHLRGPLIQGPVGRLRMGRSTLN